MANPTTTHVIEIESGIGEPAFIPLSMGTELQPISIGKKGMWRVDGARVMDVHAFVYFDGRSLFLQSADEAQAAVVDGYRIGKAWTELHAPCKIEVGGARLRFRSLLPNADGQATQAAARPPVAAPPSGGAGSPSQKPRPAAGMPPQQEAPLSFPKADRPFKPGEFSRGGQDLDESTRFAPLDSTSGGARTGASGAMPAPRASQDDDLSTRPEAVRLAPRPAGGSGAFPMQGPGMAPGQPMQGSMPPMHPGMPMQGSMPPMQPGMPMQGSMPPMQPSAPAMPPSMPATAPQPYGPNNYPTQQAYPPGPNASGGYPVQPQASLPPGGYGSMTQAQPAAPEGLAAQFAAMSVPKKILVFLLPVAMLFTVMSMFDDEAPPPPRRANAAADAGPATGSGTAAVTTAPPPVTIATAPQTPTGTLPPWPANVPCPPPGWPAGQPLPCVPNNVPVTPPPTGGGASVEAQRDAGAPSAKEPNARNLPDAGAPGQKTLERQAVDAVASGDLPRAAAIYEDLSRRDPSNRVYAEAARILRNRLDGGVP